MKPIMAGLAATLACAFPLSVNAQSPSPPDQSRILVLLAPGFNRIEYYGPATTLQSLGHQLVIASPLAGTVPLDKDGEPSPGRDVPVDLPLSTVRSADYAALFVPGGYSPAHLENDAEAVRITREFLERGQPVGMICHGPRLLIRNGLARGRTLTALHTVPDELADDWIRGPFRRYLDLPVVLDGNLVTARYPNDTAAFAREFARLIAQRQGRPFVPRDGRILWLRTDHPEKLINGHIVSSLRVAAEALGFKADTVGVTDPARLEKALAAPLDAVAWDLTPEDLAQVPAALKAALDKVPRHVARNGLRLSVPTSATAPAHDLKAWALMFARLLPEAAPNPPLPPHPPEARIDPALLTSDATQARAVLAPRDGFDDETVAILLSALAADKKTPVLVVHDRKTVRGVNGQDLPVGASYNAPLPAGAPVFAPGFFWPQKSSEVRRAVQPAWLDELDRRDAVRDAWLLARREAGHPLVLVGLDSLRLGRRPEMKGLAFSSSEQTVWSFPKDAGMFSPEPFTRTSERLWTVRAAADIPSALAAWKASSP